MGYRTKLSGHFLINRKLLPEHQKYLEIFAETAPRNARDVSKLSQIPDPIREAAGLPLGPDGAYFSADDPADAVNIARLGTYQNQMFLIYNWLYLLMGQFL